MTLVTNKDEKTLQKGKNNNKLGRKPSSHISFLQYLNNVNLSACHYFARAENFKIFSGERSRTPLARAGNPPLLLPPLVPSSPGESRWRPMTGPQGAGGYSDLPDSYANTIFRVKIMNFTFWGVWNYFNYFWGYINLCGYFFFFLTSKT